MPAIEFSRLRTKIELLGKVYDQPEQFLKDLNDLFFFYSDLTFPANSNRGAAVTTLRSYRVPAVINRELEKMLSTKASTQPLETLNIVDQLWQTKIHEACLLASALLGSLPVTYAEETLKRIETWCTANERAELIELLLTNGSATLRRENEALWTKKISDWLHSHDRSMQHTAIMGLQPLLNDERFINLPVVFDLLYPVMLNPDPHLVQILLQTVELLQKRSEPETVYFLKQVISQSKSEDLPRFIRRATPSFSESAQESLRNALRKTLTR